MLVGRRMSMSFYLGIYMYRESISERISEFRMLLEDREEAARSQLSVTTRLDRASNPVLYEECADLTRYLFRLSHETRKYLNELKALRDAAHAPHFR